MVETVLASDREVSRSRRSGWAAAGLGVIAAGVLVGCSESNGDNRNEERSAAPEYYEDMTDLVFVHDMDVALEEGRCHIRILTGSSEADKQAAAEYAERHNEPTEACPSPTVEIAESGPFPPKAKNDENTEVIEYVPNYAGAYGDCVRVAVPDRGIFLE